MQILKSRNYRICEEDESFYLVSFEFYVSIDKDEREDNSLDGFTFHESIILWNEHEQFSLVGWNILNKEEQSSQNDPYK